MIHCRSDLEVFARSSKSIAEAKARGEPWRWEERKGLGLPPLPVAGGTNVTWGFVVSDAGCILNRAEITTTTPTKEGIDLHSGGNGSSLKHFQFLSIASVPDSDSQATIYDLQQTPLYVFTGGEFGTRKLGDGTDLLQLFAPRDWKAPFENLVSEQGAQTFEQSVAGAVSPSGAIINQARTVLAGAVSSVGVIVKEARASLAGATSPVGTLIKSARLNLAGNTSPAGALATAIIRGLSLAGAISPVGALINSGATSPTGAITLRGNKSVQGAASSSGTAAQLPSITLAGTLTSAGVLVRLAAKVLTGLISPAGAVVKSALFRVLGNVSPTGVSISQANKRTQGASSPTASITNRTNYTVSGAITPSGSPAKRPAVTTAGLTAPIGNVIRRALKQVAGTISPSAILDRLFIEGGAGLRFLTLTGLIGPSGMARKEVRTVLAGIVSPTGNIAKTVLRRLLGAISPTAILAFIVGKFIQQKVNATVTIDSVSDTLDAAIQVQVTSDRTTVTASVELTHP